MSRRSQLALAISFACLTITAGIAEASAPANQADPTQQVTPSHEEPETSGVEDYKVKALTIYLQWNGKWNDHGCKITVFPEPAVIYDKGHDKNPKRVLWVVLDKDGGIGASQDVDWSIESGSDDIGPGKKKKISKNKRAFRSDKAKDKDMTSYDWDYKIVVTGKDANGNPAICDKDPKVRVRG